MTTLQPTETTTIQTTSQKDAAKTFVAEVRDKIPLQHFHDRFMLGALERLRQKMDEANEAINAKVEALLLQGDDNKEVQEQLARVLKMSVDTGSDEGVKDLQDMLANRAQIDTQLQALLGVVQYSILLASRIEVFRKIVELVMDVGTDAMNDDDIKVKMNLYGPQLQYVWQKAFQECKSMDERQIFSKVLFGKEIKLGSDQ